MIEKILILMPLLLTAAILAFVFYKRRPKKLKIPQYIERWKELQAYCRDKSTWAMAVIEADKLLDMVLTRRRFKGKSMGERLVSAQRSFSDNDGVWFAHNLSKKLLADRSTRLKEVDVKDALVCFRQALRDLGALPSEK